MANCKYDGHSFRPRYDKGPADIPNNIRNDAAVIDADAFRQITYIGDICENCGQWSRPTQDRFASVMPMAQEPEA